MPENGWSELTLLRLRSVRNVLDIGFPVLPDASQCSIFRLPQYLLLLVLMEVCLLQWLSVPLLFWLLIRSEECGSRVLDLVRREGGGECGDIRGQSSGKLSLQQLLLHVIRDQVLVLLHLILQLVQVDWARDRPLSFRLLLLLVLLLVLLLQVKQRLIRKDRLAVFRVVLVIILLQAACRQLLLLVLMVLFRPS